MLNNVLENLLFVEAPFKMAKGVKFNINTPIEVQLTDTASRYIQSTGHSFSIRNKPDAEGWYKTTLQDIKSTFGWMDKLKDAIKPDIILCHTE